MRSTFLVGSDELIRHAVYALLAAVMLVSGLGPGSRANAEAAPVELRILAINDFQGNLRPPSEFQSDRALSERRASL